MSSIRDYKGRYVCPEVFLYRSLVTLCLLAASLDSYTVANVNAIAIDN